MEDYSIHDLIKRLPVFISLAVRNAPETKNVNNVYLDFIPKFDLRGMPKNGCYLDAREAHLYLCLLKLAFEFLGATPKMDYILDQSSHEFAHLSRYWSIEGVETYVGIEFFKRLNIDGMWDYILQPCVRAKGTLTPEESIDTVIAPFELVGDYLSPQDILELEQLGYDFNNHD